MAIGRDLAGHQVESVPLIGWAGIENGELLPKPLMLGSMYSWRGSNMVHQQNIAKYPIAVIALRAPSNRLADTRPLMPALLVLLPKAGSGILTFLPAE